MTEFQIISVNLEKETISTINEVMNYTQELGNGKRTIKLHYGNKQDFYRELIAEGLNTVIKNWVARKRKEVKDFAEEDDNENMDKKMEVRKKNLKT